MTPLMTITWINQSVWPGVLISANHLMEKNHDLSTIAESTMTVYITWQWPPIAKKIILFCIFLTQISLIKNYAFQEFGRVSKSCKKKIWAFV